MTQTLARRHHVVIIGSGFGGLFAAKKLKRAGVDVTLISRTTHHLFQPLLYQVATGILSEGEIAPATREILARNHNVRVVLGDVTAIDLAAHSVTSEIGGTTTVTPYDSLIVAAGAKTSYFGNDDFATHAPGLKSVDDALDVRGRILSAFEYAEIETDPVVQEEWTTFAVVGAGATGVEMAGQIAELAHRALPHDFRSVDTRKSRIVLVDATGDVLGNFGTKLSARAANQLEKLGIEVWLNEKVIAVDDTGLTVEDTSGTRVKIPARTVVWAAGVRGNDLVQTLAEQSGAEIDRGNRVKVQPDCSLPGHPEVFVIGDMMSLNNYPGVAQVAMQQGKYVADLIRRRVKGTTAPKPFHYFDKGSMATISRFRAVADLPVGGHLRFGGFIAWVMWLAIHVIYLVGFKNRLTTLLHWTVSFIGRGRSQRATTIAQLHGRDITPPAPRAGDPSAHIPVDRRPSPRPHPDARWREAGEATVRAVARGLSDLP
jgi:NADH dehydrogenase